MLSNKNPELKICKIVFFDSVLSKSNFNIFKIYVIFSLKICDPFNFLNPEILTKEVLKSFKIKTISLKVHFWLCSAK